MNLDYNLKYKIKKWFYKKYNNTDIPTLLTYKMQICNNFHLTDKQLFDLDNYLKAIRQDIRKIFLSIQNIEEVYSKYNENKNLSDNDRETVAIYIEYIITKYWIWLWFIQEVNTKRMGKNLLLMKFII